jgi:hypothetical protein
MYGCCNFDTDKLYDLIITGSEPQAWGAAAVAHMFKQKTLVAGPACLFYNVFKSGTIKIIHYYGLK